MTHAPPKGNAAARAGATASEQDSGQEQHGKDNTDQALTIEQLVDLVLDARGAPFRSEKHADGSVTRTFRRGDIYAAIDALQAQGVIPKNGMRRRP